LLPVSSDPQSIRVLGGRRNQQVQTTTNINSTTEAYNKVHFANANKRHRLIYRFKDTQGEVRFGSVKGAKLLSSCSGKLFSAMEAFWNKISERDLEKLNKIDPTAYKRYNRYFDAIAKSRSSRLLMTAVPQKIVMNAGEWIWKKYLLKTDVGLLPKEYNKKIHGVYCPWRYYGKKDTNFFDVKLGDLPAWYARRDKSFKAIVAAIGRGYHKWVYDWFSPRLMNAAPIFHLAAMMAILRMSMEDEGRGVFVALEGLDRSGKTTQVVSLRETLEKLNTPVRVFRYPTRTGPTGIALSQYLNKTETADDHAIHLLFSADRWSTAQEIEQLLKAGTHVLADRYAYSGVAYSTAKGLDYDWCCQSDKGLPRPDIVIFLDVHAEVAQCRGDFGQELYEKVEFQKKVYNIFMEKVRDSNWRFIDGTLDENHVHKEVVWHFFETANNKAIRRSPIAYL
ncbi:hypothetical protein M513_00373, partial [Trichuris suis]